MTALATPKWKPSTSYSKKSVISRPQVNPLDILRRIQTERAIERAREEEAKKGELSFRTFVEMAWPVLEPGTRFVPNWHVDAISDHLMAVTAGDINRLIINIPPGFAKSLLVSVLWNAWEWGPKNLPHLRYLATTYSEEFTKRDTRKTRDLVRSEWYQRLWGRRVQLTRIGERSFENTARGGRDTRPFRSLTGGRGDRLLCLRGDQRILTDRGWLPIDQIVENELNCLVAGSDGKTVRWQRIEAYERNEFRRLVRVTFSGGQQVVCTHDHPIFTIERGWVAAESLQNGETARTAEDRCMPPVRYGIAAPGEQHATLVQQRMCGCGARREAACCDDALRGLLDAGLPDARPSQALCSGRRDILQHGVFRTHEQRRCQSCLYDGEGDADLRQVRECVRGEAGQGSEPIVLQFDMCVANGLGSPRRALEAEAMPALLDRVPALFPEAGLLRQDLRGRGSCGPDARCREWSLCPWECAAQVSAGLDADVQGKNPGEGWKRLPRLQGGGAFGWEGPPCPPHKLRQGGFEPEQSDNGLQVLPWDDARESGPAGGMGCASVVAVERLTETHDATFNIRVSPDHAYFAEGVLVHNCDDPHSTETAESEAERERTLRIFRESVPSRVNDQKKSAIVVVMQRLHSNDVTGEALRLDLGYTHLRLPMRFEADTACKTFVQGRLFFQDPRTIEGELLFPAKFPEGQLDLVERGMGSYAVAAQHQQRPGPREGAMFKRGWFEIVGAAPQEGKVVRAWDLAATKKDARKSPNPDWTVGIRMRRTHGGIFYIDGEIRLREESPEVERAIKQAAAVDGYSVRIRLPQDPGAAGKTVKSAYIKALAGYDVRVREETGDKATRATPFQVQAEAGNVKIVNGPWVEKFLDELVGFPGGAPHDDRVDACSAAFDELLRFNQQSGHAAPIQAR